MNRTTAFPKEILASILATLPINVHLNESFGKNILKTGLDSIETLERLVPQGKLIIDELTETIGDDSLDNVMDGIGDMITTADGLLGFVGDHFKIEDIIEENADLIMTLGLWDIETVKEFSKDGVKTVDELMVLDFIQAGTIFNKSKQFLNVITEPTVENIIKESDYLKNIMSMNGNNVEHSNKGLIVMALRIRYCADALARSLGLCPVKILKEVYESNMSKLCKSLEDAQATLDKYAQEDLTQLKIQEQGGYFAVIVTEEVMFRGQLIPAGKFMKGVDYKKPDFSNKERFELETSIV